jgi:soluble lytic murein transglycosylase
MTFPQRLMIAASTVCVLLWSSTATAQLPTQGVLPPAYCAAHACSHGAHLYAAERFEEAVEVWQKALGALPGSEEGWQARVDLLLLSATAWEAADNHLRAATTYEKVSRLHEGLRPFLLFKAAQSYARSAKPPLDILEQIVDSGALGRGYPGSALVGARINAAVRDGLPSPEWAERALSAARREEACSWMSDVLAEASPDLTDRGRAAGGDFHRLADAAYGACLPHELGEGFGDVTFTPTDAARLRRADRLFFDVKYEQTLAELDEIDADNLEDGERCRAEFRRARTLYRQRKRSPSMKIYDRIIDECTGADNETERVRSLYANGRMKYKRRKRAESKKYFEALLEHYAHRSHADDALMYLARIARDNDDTDAEKKLVARALADHPDGDMVHEVAWEHLEGLYRSGKFEPFLERLDQLKLPDADAQYFSQGRLGYFAASALSRLDRSDEAYARWQATWKRYPFSFYGYLSRQRLVEADQTPASLEVGRDGGLADWFLDSGWRQSGAGHLVRLGLYGLAADLEHARIGPDKRGEPDSWRLAYLEHLAGRYPVSHNIARRAIPGRPWAEPKAARYVRWTIAWPNPYARQILRAVVAERRQATDSETVEPALPAAIMREESGFTEDIESWAGALGLLQLMPRTALAHDDDIDGRATPKKLKTAPVNIRVGVDHLFSLARRFDSHPVLIAAAYNAGGGAVSRWLRRNKSADIALFVEDIPYDQTRNYTKRVIGSYAAYQWLEGIRELDPAVLAAP